MNEPVSDLQSRYYGFTNIFEGSCYDLDIAYTHQQWAMKADGTSTLWVKAVSKLPAGKLIVRFGQLSFLNR